MRGFIKSHPAAAAEYFLCAFALSMLTKDPAVLCCLLIGAFVTKKIISPGERGLWAFGILGISAVINPLFYHNGATVMFYLSGKAVTFEALLYGLCAGGMIAGCILWFGAFSSLFDSERLVCVCSVFSARAALMVSMTVRYVPLLKKQARRIRDAQRCMGLYGADTFIDKIRAGASVFSALVTWALENGITTADSMSARGYDLNTRTPLKRFVFGSWDACLMAAQTLLFAGALTGILTGDCAIEFYPYIKYSIARGNWARLCALVFAFIPFITETGYNLKWKYLRSKI